MPPVVGFEIAYGCKTDKSGPPHATARGGGDKHDPWTIPVIYEGYPPPGPADTV